MTHGEYEHILDQLSAYIRAHASGREVSLLQKLATRFFSDCAVDDLKNKSIENLFGILRSYLLFLNEAGHDIVRLRLFNPHPDKEGWETTHTVIQILHTDMPFLVDTTRMVLKKHDLEIHFIVHFGGLLIKRDAEGRITDFATTRDKQKDKSTRADALIYIEIDRLADEGMIETLCAEIERGLSDVRVAVADWKKMVERVEVSLKELEAHPPHIDAAELTESCDFLRWLINNHFTFLGARDYKLIGNGTNRALQLIPGSGLGVLRSESSSSAVSKSYAELPPQARKMALSKNVLIIAKTNTISTVHREAYTDYIGVKRFNEQGELIGERRFVGLYTSTAYHSNPTHIPFLRHKVSTILHDLGFPPDSHDGKEAAHILDILPRDDLFQATNEELFDWTRQIIQLKERKRIRLLVRRDAFYRYFSCLVFIPSEIFTTSLAEAMQNVLMQAFNGLECSYTTYFSTSVLARIHYLIRVNPEVPVQYNVASIEKWLMAIARSWVGDLHQQLVNQFGEAQGLQYFNRYKRAFPGSYTESYLPHEAIADIQKIEALSPTVTLAMSFINKNDNQLSLKLFQADKTIILSDILPILENMGLRVIGERQHEIKLREGKRVWINDFDMICVASSHVDTKEVKDIFREAFRRIWFGEVENDGFNRLVLGVNLTWQETTMLRAYAKYLRQAGFTLSQNYIEEALFKHPDITRSLVQLFILRFDPNYQTHHVTNANDIVRFIENALETVQSLDEDRIIRRFLEVIQATLRTNYFQRDEHQQSKSYLSFKLDPSQLSDLPLPRPKYEIFVYSSRIEGLHLRAGKVARGGLRWSDRREDFRIEVLGLMKAQQVKNTVIVPEGAKGAFVVKRAPSTEEVSYAYSVFIKGLLDLTDNIKEGKVVPPTQVVRYDEDDPYLVVAADKGTATFSDLANSITAQYHFWLDDAFASGGSAGYDHKKMGITSRGVWISVERHFRELGLNPNKDNFTVIGIGDMSGDVFGNGMLMSPHIKLVAAFNHRHVFIDPNPDPAISYTERKRLFDLPRSNWSDYNATLISQGGGVYERSAKSIRLTPEMKLAFNLQGDYLVPSDLIHAILKSSVDLIWNGGIGTFVKSSKEDNLNAGDRANDAIRVNANELKAKMIAEGGNLGMTQLARIEYSLQGGIVNTDFIDNSAGVDCSDHEVNIKILLNQMIMAKKMTKPDRNKLLKKMTQEVADLVLQDNYEQTQIISLEISQAQHKMDLFRHYMNELEKQNRLNRSLEYLPIDAEMIERKANNQPLTRPEIAVLLAYSKMYLKKDILPIDLLDEPYFDKYLFSAFPAILEQKFSTELKKHSLRKEIIATQLTKSIVDRMGVHFVERLHQETGASTEFIIKAFVIAQEVFQMNGLWNQITALDYQINSEVQYRMMLQVYYLIRRSTRWLLRNRKPNLHIQRTIDTLAPPIKALSEHLTSFLDEAGKEGLGHVVSYYLDQGVPEKLAKQIASCNALFTAFDITEAAHKDQLDLAETAKTYYRLGQQLELNTLRDLMNAYPIDNTWDELARAGFRDDIDRVQRKLTARLLTRKATDLKRKNLDDCIHAWIHRHAFLTGRWKTLLAELKASEVVGFVKYSVVLRELFDFAQAA